MNGKIKVIKGDITQLKMDAIVNAANTTLLGGGGVDGAIHRAAGPQLLAECKTLNGCATGQAKITKGYELPAQYVIHTVGPVWHGGDRNEIHLLQSCYEACFKLMDAYKLQTIAFPAISCGAYRFPKDKATRIAIQETKNALEHYPFLSEITFAIVDEELFVLYQNAIGR